MSANLLDTLIIGTAGAFIPLPVQGSIGGITIDTTIDEVYEDSLEVTEHPVEQGAEITDHSFKRPMEILLRCGWTDSSDQGANGETDTGTWTGGDMTADDYIAGIYSQILQLQESRQIFAVVAGLRSYDAMLLTRCTVRRDQRTPNSLMLEAHCKQVILVTTTSATLPPQANQQNPQNTAETVNAGTQQTQEASPSSAGALPDQLLDAL